MSWIQLNVTVTNGSNIVTVNNNLSTASVRVGDALVLAGFSPVEITGVYADSLRIASNWENAAQNGSAAAVMPTFGDFDNAAATMRQFTQTTQGNLAAMEAWWTQQNGSVTFKGQDGVEHQVRSAKQMDQDVQAKTDAVQQVTDEMVSLVGAQVALTQPDVYIPFNDSLQIVRGFGKHDQIDVSADQDGSVVVELPTKSVEFSRASGRPHDTKSDRLISLSVDEPGFDKGGLALYGSATLHSSSATDLNLVTDADLAITNELSPDGESYWMQISYVDNGYYDVYSNQGTFVNNDDLIFSCHIKKQTGKIRLHGYYNVSPGGGSATGVDFDSRTGVVTPIGTTPPLDYGVFEYDGHYRIWVRLRYLDSNSDQNRTLLRILTDYDRSSSLIWGYNVSKSKVPLSYKAMSSNASLAYGVDSASIPTLENFPGPGKPFTIVVESGASATFNDDVYFIFETSGGVGARIGIYIQFNRVRVRFGNGINEQSDTLNAIELGKERHRFILRYTGDELYIGTTKELKKANTTLDLTQLKVDLEGMLMLGSNGGGGQNLNSSLRELSIYHRALSDAECKALGEPK